MIEVVVKVLTLIAFVCTILMAVKNSVNAKLNPNIMLWAGIWGIGGAIGGGFLLSFVDNQASQSFQSINLITVITYNKGTFGAFLGTAIFSAAYLYHCRESFLKYADVAIPAIALGYAIARIGCFINGDDFGALTNIPWAVSFENGTVAYYAHMQRGWIDVSSGQSLLVHPAQLYSSLVGLFCFLFLTKYKSNWQGEKLAIALSIYGITRLVIQFYRDDHYVTSALLDQSQWFALFYCYIIGLWLNNSLRKNENALLSPASTKIFS